MLVVTLIVIFTIILVLIFAGVYYKNRFYAYSSKRVIIRTGIIGIDFKSLEFKFLTATKVNVSVLDKILGQGTGSISFGSPSSPIGGASSGNINQYNFRHICKPYDTMREIKESIDVKEEKSHD
jgi:hypothetical protein